MPSKRIRMASIRRLWLNVLFLLLTQRDKCDATSSTVALLNSSSTHWIYSTSSIGDDSDGNNVTSTSTAHMETMLTITLSSNSLHATATKSTTLTSNLSATSLANSTMFRSSASRRAVAVEESKTSSNSVFATSITGMSNSPSKLQTSSSEVLRAVISSTVSSTVVSGVPTDHDDEEKSEPKKTLYVWQLVAIGCGAFVFVLFIIIGLLCYQNRVLKKKLNTSRSYSLPIKDNGAWIDSQDIPLWQKRASAFVSENPTAEAAPTLTT